MWILSCKILRHIGKIGLIVIKITKSFDFEVKSGHVRFTQNSLCDQQCRIKGQRQTELQTAARHGQKDCDIRPADIQQRAGHREVRAFSPQRGHPHSITTNNSFNNDKHVLNYVFSALKCSFRAMRTCRMFFSTVTDVVLNWSQPCLNAQLCFSVYICFLRLCTRRWVCGYAVLQSICVVPVWFCCSEEHVCVSGVRSALEPREECKEQWYAPAWTGRWRKTYLHL